jgi:2-polyprenyl-3-methyl-5-hydroxy-6-metoxy-1,4-benzoquinol methylase
MVTTKNQAGSRSARERAYWDDAYDPGGINHGRYVWVKDIENRSHLMGCFYRALLELDGKRVLSLGGGLDHVAVTLAQGGNRVVSVDISPMASARTRELAARSSVAGNVETVTANCEELRLEEGEFDAVVCKRALHHMDLTRVVAVTHHALAPGGMFIAEEPICLSRTFRWLHARFPFAPSAPRTLDEKELTQRDLDLICHTFRETRYRYFDFLARESVAYFLSRVHLVKLLGPLGRFDDLLINHSPPVLKGLATYILIQAHK